jgi:glycosidase
MDFPLHYALLAGLKDADQGEGGIYKLYETLAHDFVYADANRLVVFEGNHDTPRLYSLLGEDLDLLRMAWSYLCVVNRIPQFFYGTELLLTSPQQRDDGRVRADFPGGFAGDAVDGFSGRGLSPRQREAQDLLRRLLNWRKIAKVVHHGRLVHYAAIGGVYVLFRELASEKTVMLVINKNHAVHSLALHRFADNLGDARLGRNILDGQEFRLHSVLTLPPRSCLLLELFKSG